MFIAQLSSLIKPTFEYFFLYCNNLKTHFSGFFILHKHFASLFLPFFLLQLLSGQWVTVVVSRQEAEIAIFLWVKVETRQL